MVQPTNRIVAAILSVAAVVLFAASAYDAAAETVGRYWAYHTSETGNTQYDTLEDAETAMRAEGDAESYLQYTGEDVNDELKIRMQYAAVPQTDYPDDSLAWGYKACDWDLGNFECGPGTGPQPPHIDESTALTALFGHAYYTCGIDSGPTPATDWWQGEQPIGAPTGTPAAPYQEWQVRNYNFVTRRHPAGGDDCSALEGRTAFVYRYRVLQCPAGYTKVGPDAATGQFHCENNLTAEITKDNNSYKGNAESCLANTMGSPQNNGSPNFFGNPCDPATGSKYEVTTDYEAPGISFTRTFRSNMAPWANEAFHIRRMPRYWTHSYVRFLKLDSTSTAPSELLRPNGTTVPVKLLSGHADTYMAVDASGTHVKPGTGAGEWDVFLSDGSHEHYDSVTCSTGQSNYTRPRLAYIEDANGNQTLVAYPDNCSDHPDSVTGPFGHSISITYSPFNPFSPTFVEKITDSADQDIVFGYSGGNTGTLDTVTYQDGKSLTYHYEDTKSGNELLLTGITDEESRRFSTYAYDFAGRAISTEHSGGDFGYTASYDTFGIYNPNTYVTDAAGNNFDYRLAGTNWGPARVNIIIKPDGNVYFYYEGSGQYRLTKVKDEKSVETTFSYDDFHQTELVEASNRWQDKRTTTYEYLNNTSDLRTKTIRPSVCDDGTTRYAEDEIVYLPNTQTVSQIISRGYRKNGSTCDAIDQTITFSNYNTAGQPRQIDGPRTDVADTTTLEYYECSTGGQCGQIKKVTNALNHVTSFDGYDSHGRLLQMTDANGLVINYAYDTRGRLTSVTETPTSGSQRVTSFTYEATDLVKTVTVPSGLVLTYTYNDAHRLTSISDNLGNQIDYGYDIRGNRTDEDVFDSSSTLKRAVDYTYDVRNRLDTINSGGFVTDITFDSTGTLKDDKDANNALTKYTYDYLYRLTRITDANNFRSDFDYDVADNLVYVKTPTWVVTNFEYDDLGNLLEEDSPDRGTTTYTYDDAGNLASKTDARNKQTTYAYDALNRLTTETLDGGQTITYNYDLNTNGKGRLSNVVDPSGTTAWLYDNFGAITQKQQTAGGVTLTTGYTYNAAGQVATMTLPSGTVVSYTYNNHLLSSIAVGGQTLLSGVTYDPFGPTTGWTWGDLTVSSRVFNTRGLITSHSMDADTRTLGYDPVGQITTIDDARHDLGITYDLLGRLTNFTSTAIPGGANLPGSQTFTYDNNGNRKSLNEDGSTSTYTIQSASNRLTSITGAGARTYTYDAAGNTIGDGTNTFGYDDRGRFNSFNSGATTYQHNALGQRVVKNSGSNTLFVYDEAGQLIGEYDAIGTPIIETVYFDGAPTAVVKGVNTYEVHSDHLQIPRLITDSGTIVWRWESDPFGSSSPDEDPDGDMTTFSYNVRFPGQYFDSESGLHYNYFRTYDPNTGRYLESDPIGLEGGLNTYGYVGANPLNYFDPYGQFEVSPRTKDFVDFLAKATRRGAITDAMTPDASDAAWPKWAVWATAAAVTAGIAEICEDDSDDCLRLYEEINALVNQLIIRHAQLREDKLDLYNTRKTGPMSWEGHRQQFHQIQRTLRAKLVEANTKGCIGYRTDAYYWATRHAATKPAP